MYYRARFELILDSPLKGRHRSFSERLRGFLSANAGYRSPRENLPVDNLLPRIGSALSSLGMKNLTRIRAGDVDRFFDPNDRWSDLGGNLAEFARNQGDGLEGGEPIELIIDGTVDGIRYVVRIEVWPDHGAREAPVTVAVEGVAEPAAGTQGEKSFTHFVYRLEQEFRRVLPVAMAHIDQNVSVDDITQPVLPVKSEPVAQPAAQSSRPVPLQDGVTALFPLYGVTLGVTTVAELERLGQHGTMKDDKGEPYRFYMIGDMNFWYSGGKATMMYLTHSEPLPEQWQAMGMDWQKSFVEWKVFLAELRCFVSIPVPPHTVRHYSGLHDSFEAELAGHLQTPAGTLAIELNFNYSEGTRETDRETLYGITLHME